MKSALIDHEKYKEKTVVGRYVSFSDIADFLNNLPKSVTKIQCGFSVLGAPIYSLTMGTGATKILMWSQMHGNESTTTKAVLDALNYFLHNHEGQDVLSKCTIMVIPMLNPDGATSYTRVNANKIDLNRDAQDLSQPESKVLRNVFEEFRPDFCFNLHDQRTIFSAGPHKKPATVSFLSPAADQSRSVTASRAKAMQVISVMNADLQKYIPNQVGRYDDGFNSNCVGDYFQMQDVPTILFEAGHFPGDYGRETTRFLIYKALLCGVSAIVTNSFKEVKVGSYLLIPENEKLYVDVLVKNAHLINKELPEFTSVALQYEEQLVDGVLDFNLKIHEKGLTLPYFGHEEYDCAFSDKYQKLISCQSIVKLLL